MKNPSAEVDMTSVEFLRDYDPAVKLWAITEIGRARVVAGNIPHGLGIKGPEALRRLSKVVAADEDEIGSWVGVAPAGAKRLMKRLAGFGLVAQAT